LPWCIRRVNQGRRIVAIPLALNVSFSPETEIMTSAIWLVGHVADVWAAKRDAAFVDVVRRHLRCPQQVAWLLFHIFQRRALAQPDPKGLHHALGLILTNALLSDELTGHIRDLCFAAG
jgi:hypothetical protein